MLKRRGRLNYRLFHEDLFIANYKDTTLEQQI